MLAAEAVEGPSASERAAVVTLLAHPGRPVSWLGAVLGLTSSGVTRLVDRLVGAGWVTRTSGPDARSRVLQLTQAGRECALDVLRARRAALADAVAGLAAPDRAELERLLDQVVTGLATTRLPALQVCRMCDREAFASGGHRCPLEHTVPPENTGSADDRYA